MSDSAFGASGEIRLAFLASGLSELVGEIGGLRDVAGPDLIAELDLLEKQALALSEAAMKGAQAQADMTAATEAASAAAGAGVAQWSAYTKALQDANAQYREFRQQQVMGADASVLAAHPGNPANIDPALKSQYLDTADANSANIVQALKAEEAAQRAQLDAMNSLPLDAHVAAYERYNSELETASKQTALYNQYLYDEQVAADKAAAAQLRLAEGQKAADQSLSTTKYALYDMSNALALTGAGLLALPVASALMATSFQKDFASVQRVFVSDATPTQLTAIKQELIDLSTQIPVTFKDLTQIATAGAQLGIPAAGIVEFTKVVAEMTKTANVSAQTVETFLQKFYLIADVKPDQFENLASAILNVSIHTGAAEQQISLLATRIVGVGQQAGFNVPQIIGLAAAMASLSAQSASYELGTFTRLVEHLQTAVESGGPALDAFAKTAGLTDQQVQATFGTDKFAGTFQSFIDGLAKMKQNGGDVIAVLKDMGITSVRDIPAIENLAAAHKTLATAMKEAQEGWDNASILAQHYKVIQDTLSSKTTELKNSFEAFMNSMGSSSTAPLTQLVSGLTEVVKGITAFGNTAGGHEILNWAAEALVAVGAVALLSAGVTRLAGLGVDVIQAFKGIADAVAKFKAAEDAAAAASATGEASLSSLIGFITNPFVLGIAAGVVAVGALSSALDSMRASSGMIDEALINPLVKFKGLVSTVTQGDSSRDFLTTLFGGASTTQEFNNLDATLVKVKAHADNFFNGLFDTSLINFATDARNVDSQLASLAQTNLPGAQVGFDKLAEKTDGSREKLWTLLNDAMPQYRDELTKQLEAQGKSVNQTTLLQAATGAISNDYLTAAKSLTTLYEQQQKVASNQQELATSFANGSKDVKAGETAYEKAVAPLYDMKSVLGQVQTAMQAQAQAAADNYNANKKAGDASKSAKDFYDGTSVSLDAYTKQLNDNASTLTTWNANLIAVTGKYGSQVAQQFVQMGATATSESLLAQLTAATPAQGQAYVDALTKVTDQAGQAQADAFLAAGQILTNDGHLVGADTAAAIGKAMIAGEPIDDIIKQYHLKWANQPDYALAVSTADAQSKINAFIANNTGRVIQMTSTISGGQPVLSGGLPGTPKIYAEGGYTGDGTKFQPAGVVHAGEFVFSQAATRNIGIANLAYAHEMAKTGKGYAEGGFVGSAPAMGGGGGVVVVALSAYDRALLAAAGNLTVTIPGTAIMQAANQGNVSANTRRSN